MEDVRDCDTTTAQKRTDEYIAYVVEKLTGALRNKQPFKICILCNIIIIRIVEIQRSSTTTPLVKIGEFGHDYEM